MLGLNRMKTISAALVVVAAGWAGAAQAATVTATCPDTGVWDRYFTVSSDDPDVTSIDCYAWGDEANDNLDQALLDQLEADGYEYLGKVEDGTSPDDVFDDMVDLIGGTEGEFELTDSVEVVLVFKVGAGTCKGQGKGGVDVVPGEDTCVPIYAAFEITTTGEALLAWETSPLNQGLSHVSIYVKTAAVPVPAAGLLLVGALGALGLAKRRRRAA